MRTDINEIKKILGINNPIEHRIRKTNKPKYSDTDMCYVIGRTDVPMAYSRVKKLGISDDMILSSEPYSQWLEERDEYLRQQEEIRKAKNNIELPF